MLRILFVSMTGLLLAGNAQASTNPNAADEAKSKVVTFAGVKVTLPIPRGYCEIPRASEQGKLYYDLQEQGNRGTNVVAMLFADCAEWVKREADHNYRIHRFGSYLFPIPDGEKLVPADYTRAAFIREVAGTKVDSAQMLKDVETMRARSEVESSKPKSLSIRPLSSDASAAYFVSAAEIQYPNEKPMVCFVMGITIVNHAAVSMNLYRDYSRTQDMLDLLEQQKRNMANLVRSNR